MGVNTIHTGIKISRGILFFTVLGNDAQMNVLIQEIL